MIKSDRLRPGRRSAHQTLVPSRVGVVWTRGDMQEKHQVDPIARSRDGQAERCRAARAVMCRDQKRHGREDHRKTQSDRVDNNQMTTRLRSRARELSTSDVNRDVIWCACLHDRIGSCVVPGHVVLGREHITALAARHLSRPDRLAIAQWDTWCFSACHRSDNPTT